MIHSDGVMTENDCKDDIKMQAPCLMQHQSGLAVRK